MSPQKKRKVIKKKGGEKIEETQGPQKRPEAEPKPEPEVQKPAPESPVSDDDKALEADFEELEAMTLPDPTLMDRDSKPAELNEESEPPAESETPEEPLTEPEDKLEEKGEETASEPEEPEPQPVEKPTEQEEPISVDEPEPEVVEKVETAKSAKEMEALLDEVDEPTIKISKTLLIVGLLLCGLGLIGMLGLRAGFIQSLLGDAAPYPGIGTVEPTGHIVSVIPLLIGIVTIAAWGFKNDSAYYELEKRKEEAFSFEESDAGAALEPTEVPKKKEPLPEPAKPKPVRARPVRPVPKAAPAAKPVAEPGAPKREKPVEAKPEKPTEEPSALALEYAKAEDERIAKCETILGEATLLPEDAKSLGYLIATGISPEEFKLEVEKAEKKKKEAEMEKMSSEQKAAVLEQELASELAELEEELGDDDEEDLEEKILKEIEDLEGL